MAMVAALELLIEDNRWAEVGLEALVQSAATATLTYVALDPALCAGAVLACDDAKIADLNADFRGKATATNVLSWPAEERACPGQVPGAPDPDFDGTIELGDIAIAYETCTREAKEAAKPVADHVQHLIVHGILHLLGYDHTRDDDAEIMESAEVAILAEMGLSNPYLLRD